MVRSISGANQARGGVLVIAGAVLAFAMVVVRDSRGEAQGRHFFVSLVVAAVATASLEKWNFEYSIATLHPDIVLQLGSRIQRRPNERDVEPRHTRLSGEIYYDPKRVDGASLAAVVQLGEWDQPEVSGI